MKKLTHLISITAFAALLSLNCETKMEYTGTTLVEESDSTSLMKKGKKRRTGERIVHGRIDRSGIVAGSGFTLTVINPQDSNPQFVVRYNTPFSAEPTLALTLIASSPRSAPVILKSDFSATQFTAWANLGANDDGLFFIAIGPK